MTDLSPPETRAQSKAAQAQAELRIARLRSAVRERDARLRELETRLAALQASTTYQFGRLVAGAVRRPRRAARLPRELYLLWRQRNSAKPAARGRGNARARPDGHDGYEGHDGFAGYGRAENRLLAAAPSALKGTDRALAIVGVFGPGTIEHLTGFAHAVPLFPHDARLVLESTDADLLVVDTAAGTPGGPWAYLGEPGMFDRERTLNALLDTAKGRGLPAVLWEPAGRADNGELSGAATAPGLRRLGWDATGTPGISLRRFNPIGGSGERDRTALVVDPGPRLPLGVRRTIEAIASALDARTVAAGTTGTTGTAQRADLLRAHAVTIAATPAQVPEQLACGALVLCPAVIADALPADLRRHVHVVADPAVAAAVLAAAEPPPDPRAALRTVFLEYATPVRLARLCARLGIDADPLAERRVAVVADVHGEAAARRLVDTVSAQLHRPAEVVLRHPVDAPAGMTASVTAGITGRLTELGITVHTQSTADRAGTPGRAAWVAPWPSEGQLPATYLADLVCAAECSGADAVGHGGTDFGFVAKVRPALIGRKLHGPGGAPADWVARGARLLSVDLTR